MEDSADSNGEVAVWAKLIVFCTIPTIIYRYFEVTYLELGLSFLASSLIQALIPPRRKGLVQMLTVSSIATLLALVLQWRCQIR